MSLFRSVRQSVGAWQPWRGLGRRLLASHLLLAILPLVTLSVILLLMSRAALSARTFDQLSSVVQLKRADIERFFRQKRDLTTQLGDDFELSTQTVLLLANPDSGSAAAAILSRLLVVVHSDGDYQELFLLDARDGRLLVSSLLREQTGLAAGQEFFEQGKAATYVSPIAIDPASNQPVLVVSAPMRNVDNQVVAVVVGIFKLDDVEQTIRAPGGIGATGDVYLVDQAGTPLFSQRLDRQPAASQAIAGVQARQSGQARYRNPRGIPVIGVYDYLPDQRLGLVAEQDEAEAFTLSTRIQWLIVTVGFGALLAIGLAAMVLARSIAQPILAMADSARAISAGDLAVAFPTGAPDEVGELAAVFEQMAGTLQERDQALRSRQGELERANGELLARGAELAAALEAQAALALTIRQLSTPVLPVLPGVLVLPLIGALDDDRTHQIQGALLAAIERFRAHTVLLDITGVPVIDQSNAGVLLRGVQAARLLGARVMVIGITPEVAQALVSLDLDLGGLDTAADLRSAIVGLLGDQARQRP